MGRNNYSMLINYYLVKYKDKFVEKLREDIISAGNIKNLIDNLADEIGKTDYRPIRRIIKKLPRNLKVLYDYLTSYPNARFLTIILNVYKPLTYNDYVKNFVDKKDVYGAYPSNFSFEKKGDSLFFSSGLMVSQRFIKPDEKDISRFKEALHSQIYSPMTIVVGETSRDALPLYEHYILSCDKNDPVLLFPKNHKIIDILLCSNKFDDPGKKFLMDISSYNVAFCIPESTIIRAINRKIAASGDSEVANFLMTDEKKTEKIVDQLERIFKNVYKFGIKVVINMSHQLFTSIDKFVKNKSAFTSLSYIPVLINSSKIMAKHAEMVMNAKYASGRITDENLKYIEQVYNSIRTYDDLRNLVTNPIEIFDPQGREELKRQIKELIVGQDKVIDQIIDDLSISSVIPSEIPTSVLIAGPTGVGKTMFAKSLAKVLDIPFFEVSMNLLTQPHTVSSLLGSPPGYVGYERDLPFKKFLTSLNYNKYPSGILLLDEIEKAHPSVIQMFMGLLDGDGIQFYDGTWITPIGLTVIATANGDMTEIYDAIHKNPIGFDNATTERETKYQKQRKNVIESLRRFMAPEILNRFFTVVEMSKLTEAHLLEIAKRGFKYITKRAPKSHEIKRLKSELKGVDNGREAYRIGQKVGFEYYAKKQK